MFSSSAHGEFKLLRLILFIPISHVGQAAHKYCVAQISSWASERSLYQFFILTLSLAVCITCIIQFHVAICHISQVI